jgi:hypothetical protein
LAWGREDARTAAGESSPLLYPEQTKTFSLVGARFGFRHVKPGAIVTHHQTQSTAGPA